MHKHNSGMEVLARACARAKNATLYGTCLAHCQPQVQSSRLCMVPPPPSAVHHSWTTEPGGVPQHLSPIYTPATNERRTSIGEHHSCDPVIAMSTEGSEKGVKEMSMELNVAISSVSLRFMWAGLTLCFGHACESMTWLRKTYMLCNACHVLLSCFSFKCSHLNWLWSIKMQSGLGRHQSKLSALNLPLYIHCWHYHPNPITGITSTAVGIPGGTTGAVLVLPSTTGPEEK